MSVLQATRNARDVILLEKKAHQTHSIGEVKLPRAFYCDWITPEDEQRSGIKKADIQKQHPNCCFNHLVGMPTVKFEDQEGPPMPLFQYQKRLLNLYRSTKYYAQNKCRGAGTTELKVIRWNAFWYANIKNRGRKCLILAGINEDMAKEFLHRMKMLLDKIPGVYLFPPKTDYPSEIFFKQGASIWALPAHPNAVRGLENVGDVDYDEAAQWARVDDNPVLTAGEPHVAKSRAHVSHFSTPQGQLKYFWEKIFDPNCSPPTKYTKHVLNWREAVGIPEPNPEVLTDLDLTHKDEIDKIYIKKYNNDKKYRDWFNQMWPHNKIEEIIAVDKPILDVQHIVNLYRTDRALYQQEFDNQFVLSEDQAFGTWEYTDEVPSERFVQF